MTTATDLASLQAASAKLTSDIAALQGATVANVAGAAQAVAADAQALAAAAAALATDLAPPATPPAPTVSPDGTFLWPGQGGSLTDAAGETITLGAGNMIMVNGQAAGRAVNFLKMSKGSAYGSDGANWFVVANGTATYANPDQDPDPSVPNTPPGTAPAPNGGSSGSAPTSGSGGNSSGSSAPPAAGMVVPGSGSATSSTGHVYSLASDGSLLIDGAAPTYASNGGQPLGGKALTLQQLYPSGGSVYFFTDGDWCVLYDDGTWAECDPDHLGAAPKPGNPVPPATPPSRAPAQGSAAPGNTAPPGASPDGTQIFSPTSNPNNALTSVTAITDAKGQIWTLGATAANGTAPAANYPVLINGAAPASAWTGVMLTCLGGNLYGVNAAVQWYSFDSSGNPTAIDSLPGVMPTSSLPAPSADLSLLNATPLAPNSFAAIPNTAFNDVLEAMAMEPPANGDPSMTFKAWGGGAFDYDNHVFLFSGEGHTDGGGNPVYAIALSDCVPRRLTNASPVVIDGTKTGQAAYSTTDGTPLATHSYGGLIWSPALKAMLSFCQAPYPSGVAGNSGLMDQCSAFDPATKTWKTVAPGSILGAPNGEAYLSGQWSNAKGRAIIQRSGSSALLDPTTGTAVIGGGQLGDIGTSNSCLDDVGGKLYSLAGQPWSTVLARTDCVTLDMDDLFGGGSIGPVSDRAPNIIPILLYNNGIDWDSKRKLITIWDGGTNVWTIDPATLAIAQYVLAPGSFAPVNETPDGVFGRWRYLAEIDQFVGLSSLTQGLVRFQPGASTPIVPQLDGVKVTTGSAIATTNSTTAATMSAGASMSIAAGTFSGFSDAADNTTISGVAGVMPNGLTPVAMPTALTGFAPGTGGIGCLSLTGDNTTVSNLSCSGSVSGENSSGIRHQGGALTLQNLDLFGNDMNFLSAPTDASNSNKPIVFDNVVTRDSVDGNEYNHCFYISVSGAGGPSSFTMKGGGSYRATGEGHLGKSRALITILTNVDLIMGDANSSRCLDVSDGGQMLVQYCRLQQGPNSDNADMIGYADEYPGNALNVDGPSAINTPDFGTVAKLIGNYPMAVSGNVITLTGAPSLPTGTQLIPATTLNDGNFPAPLAAYTAYQWISLSATTGRLAAINTDGSTGATLALPDIAAGTFSLMFFQPDPQRVHSALITNSILIFDLQSTMAGPVVVASNGIAKTLTLNGVTVPAVPVVVKNCTIINRSKNALTFPDPANLVQDGGGNTVIDEYAKPGSLVAAGMLPYPWLPPLPTMPAAA